MGHGAFDSILLDGSRYEEILGQTDLMIESDNATGLAALRWAGGQAPGCNGWTAVRLLG